MELESLGWDPTWEEHLSGMAIEGAFPGRVSSLSGRRYALAGRDGEIDAILSGSFRYASEAAGDLPCVGDWVVVQKRSDVHPYEIVSILPRRNKLSRKVSGKTSVEQLIAANIDTVFIVTSADEDFNVKRLERYLALAYEIDALPVIILNKIDTCDDPDAYLSHDRLASLDVPILGISARDGHNIDALDTYLGIGRTIVLLGSSGVGKSTIINRLLGSERQAVGEIRSSDGKGRHITTSRELIVLPGGGIMIDNPGIREIQLWSSDHGLSRTFQDITDLSYDCRFRDCRHDVEPGCAVMFAVDSGALPRERLENYRKLMREQEYLELRRNTHERRKQDRKFGKLVRTADDIRRYKERR